MTYTQLIADVKFWVAGDSTKTIDYTAADINANLNNYYNEVVSIIMQADGRWEWDDNNLTTLPIATTDIVSGQGDYEIDAADFLNVIKVVIKDSSGNKTTLEPISYENKRNVTIDSLDETEGTPTMYDKVGNSIMLHTIPNYSSTAGLKVYFQRTPSYFETSDTTKTPGFNPLYHRYLSMGAALDYCSVNEMDGRVNLLMNKMDTMRRNIMDSYSKRSRDEKLTIRPAREDYGNDMSVSSSTKIYW